MSEAQDSCELASPATPPRRLARRRTIAFVVVVAIACSIGWFFFDAHDGSSSSAPAPEAATGLQEVTPVVTRHWIAVTAHGEATRVAAEILERGGTALDATVAAQAALTLVEPQSSGLGGGAFLLYYDAKNGKLSAYDGRETAPATVSPELFLDDAGQPISFRLAMLGGRAVGTPGVVRLLSFAHARHGALPWQQLFARPIELARAGFKVNHRLRELLTLDDVLPLMPETRAHFFNPQGQALSVGSSLVNPRLAETLQLIANEGADVFYTGVIAHEIVRAVRAAKRPTSSRLLLNKLARVLGLERTGTADVPAPGQLSLADLANYRVIEREPVCGPYRDYLVCGFPPPSSGGVAVLQALKYLERFNLRDMDANSVSLIHLLTEAERLAYADREEWIADPGFAVVPTSKLLDPDYLRARGARIHLEHRMDKVTAGALPGEHAELTSTETPEVPSTTHSVIVDSDGSIACFTSSIEAGFGSHVMVRGFLLNNQLTDFSFTPKQRETPVRNGVAPEKRPRSSMSPTIVFDQHTRRPVLALGSPGGPRIIGYVLRAMLGILDAGLSPQQAVALPHVLNMNAETEVEDLGWASQRERDELIRELKRRGHETTTGPQNSGLHAVSMQGGSLVAGVDPRREGLASGK